MLQQAINTYDEVVSLPNVPSDLIKLSLKREADRQQFLGKFSGWYKNYRSCLSKDFKTSLRILR